MISAFNNILKQLPQSHQNNTMQKMQHSQQPYGVVISSPLQMTQCDLSEIAEAAAIMNQKK